MNIAFFAVHTAFRPYGSGGIEAITKRLSQKINENDKLFLVRYGCRENSTRLHEDGTTIADFVTFENAMSFMEDMDNIQVILIYIKLLEKIKLTLRNIVKPGANFHRLITTYPRSHFRLILDIVTSVLYTNGNLYVCSERLLKQASKFSRKVFLLLPPVSDCFFDHTSKRQNSKSGLSVGFMGRIDYGKGADLALNYFEKSNIDAHFKILGYGEEKDPFVQEFKIKLDRVSEHKNISLVSSNPKANDLGSLIMDIDSVDVFILPYRYLQSTIDTPLVVLELLVLGKKIIASNIDELAQLDVELDCRLCFAGLDSYKEIDRAIHNFLDLPTNLAKVTPNYSQYSVRSVHKNLMQSFERR